MWIIKGAVGSKDAILS